MKQNGSFSSTFNKTDFPFMISDSEGVNEKFRCLHYHREVEICYIKKGTGKYLINGIEYPYSAGDVFVINNDQIHLAYDEGDLVMQVLTFDPSILWAGNIDMMDYEYLKPFNEAGESYSNKLDKKHAHIGKVIHVLGEIEKEYQDKNEGYKLMVKSLLLRLMTLIIRYFMDKQGNGGRKNIRSQSIQRLKGLIDYIDENFNKSLKLEELAQISQLSVSHLSTLFNAFAGTSPVEYIIRRRINAAIEMLKSTDKKILEIAMDCGFGSLSNFNRSFKIYTGLSPNLYRKT